MSQGDYSGCRESITRAAPGSLGDEIFPAWILLMMAEVLLTVSTCLHDASELQWSPRDHQQEAEEAGLGPDKPSGSLTQW